MWSTILGWGLWATAAALAISWGLGIRAYARSGQSVMRQTVTQAMLFAVSTIVVPLFGVSPFHLLWMLPVGFTLGALSVVFPFSLLWRLAYPYGGLWCIGLGGAVDGSDADGKWDLVRDLAKRRIADDPSARSMGLDPAQLDSLGLEELAGLPESTVIIIVETYAILSKQGVADRDIFQRIEAHRSPMMGSGEMPDPVTLCSYTRYRVNLENEGFPILDRYIARATDEAKQFFGLSRTPARPRAEKRKVEDTPDRFCAMCGKPRSKASVFCECGYRFHSKEADQDPLHSLRTAAERGDADAQFRLGVLYAEGARGSSGPDEAAKWYRLAAENGHAEGQYQLGAMYARGDGVPQDLAEAAKWYQRAADQGYTVARYFLNSISEHGDTHAQRKLNLTYTDRGGAPQNDVKVQRSAGEPKTWEELTAENVTSFRRADEQGDHDAPAAIGPMHQPNGPASQDDVEAAKSYRLAAERGEPNAQIAIGLMCYLGVGVPQDDAEAARWLRLAAARGDSVVQFTLGTIYHAGRGVAQDDAEAARWFRLAAEQGYANAQYNLGIMSAKGAGVAQDASEALQWFRLAAEQGHSDAQLKLGTMYHSGVGVPLNPVEAAKWFRFAAAQGDRDAQFNLGTMYHAGEGVPQGDADAVWWYRKAADQGLAEAQFNLGSLYQAGGAGVPQDNAEAAKWFRLAADQGRAEAQYILGEMYRLGQGVPQDAVEAVRWNLLAAEQGYANAQYNLGFMYGNGHGVPQDDAEAIKWYRLAAEHGHAKAQFYIARVCLGGDKREMAEWLCKAAEQGLAEAQYALGGMYSFGMGGVPRDDAAAVKWFRLAAEQGSAKAQNALGVMYAKGRGLPEDQVQAHMWLDLAAARASEADTELAERRDEIAAKMSPERVAEAQRLAREWKPKAWDELKPSSGTASSEFLESGGL